MSVFGLFGCMVNRHDPDRRGVTWNGQDYVGECRHCGVAIARVSRRNWRRQKREAGDEIAG